MFVGKSDCLSEKVTCQRGVDFIEQPIMMSSVGPLSALKSGNLIGLARGSGQIYYLSLVDRADLSKGIEALEIGRTEGDPYMYTDFTGSTLYESSYQDYRVILSDSDKFDPSLAIAKLNLKTIPHDGESLDWTGYELAVRCGNSSGDGLGDFEALPDAAATVKGAEVGVSMCQGSVYNEIQIRIKKTNENAQPLRIKAIGVTFEQ